MVTQVGVRELKNRLSEYLCRAKAGEEIIVTEHKKPIARILAYQESIPEQMGILLREDSATWGGSKPGSVKAVEPAAESTNTVGHIVTEDRR